MEMPSRVTVPSGPDMNRRLMGETDCDDLRAGQRLCQYILSSSSRE